MASKRGKKKTTAKTTAKKTTAEKRHQQPKVPSGKPKVVMDVGLAKALSHAYRSHILATLGDRIASPKEMADEIGIEANDLNYHIKVLVRMEKIRLVGIEKRRGVHEHFYALCSRVVYLDDSEWKRLPEPIQSSLSASLLQLSTDEAIRALRAGTFNARNSHQSRTTMLLGEQGCAEMAQVLDETLEKMLAIRKKSAVRLKKGSEEGIPMAVIMMGFETAAGAKRNRGSDTTENAS